MQIINMLKKAADELMQKVEDRKFKFAILLTLIATLLLIMSDAQWVTGHDFLNFAKFIFITYLGGNVGQKVFANVENGNA